MSTAIRCSSCSPSNWARPGEQAAGSNQRRLWVHATLDALTVAPKEHWHVILAGPALRAAHHGCETRLHRRRHPVAGARHRSQHGDLQPVERRAARLAAGRAQTRATGDAHQSRTGPGCGPAGWTRAPTARGPGSPTASSSNCGTAPIGFSGLMASQSSLSTWQVRFDGGAQEEARGRLVSGGFFQVLGVSPAIGRVFTTADDRADFAARRHQLQLLAATLRRPSDVLGKTLTVRNAALTIIGVTPPGFIGETSGQQPDFWLPLRAAAPRAARRGLAARYAAGQGDVAARVRTAETGSDAGAGRRRRPMRSFRPTWNRSTAPPRQARPPRAFGPASPNPAGRARRVVDAQ